MTQPPVGIDRDDARREVADELRDPGYEREGLWDRFVRLVSDAWDTLTDSLGGGGSWWAVLVIAGVLGAAAVLLAWALRGAVRDRTATAGALFGAAARTAAEHRATSAQLAREQRWAEAIQERVRAIARDLEERAIVSALPGRTADELSALAGRELPAHADDLAAVAVLFDEVTYGQHSGTPDGYATAAAIDEALRSARPVVATS
ncbi:MAG: DUF4129 domain-containing protein [Propionibacteriales bacterium]|nr:DUF4129 domain-containing protein [Propionibacteriales bacterium]